MFDPPTAPDSGRLAVRIRDILVRGLTVGPDTLGFIESTLPAFRAGDPAPPLEADGGADAESVLALLFFPDEEVQLEIEEFLAGQGLTPGEVDLLVARLTAPPLALFFDFADGGGRLQLELTDARARQWVGHLRLTRAVPPALEGAIASALGPSEANRFRVLWRNARCHATPAAVDFLGRLLYRFDVRERQGRAGLDFMLEFLFETGDEADIYRRLVERKRRLADALARSRRQQAALARGTMETLIARGVRLVAVDAEETRRQMAWIDQACLAAFGRVEAIDFPGDPL